MRAQSSLIICFSLCLVLAACGGKMTSDEYKEAGQKAFLAKNYPEARVNFHKALHEKPSDKELLYYLGMAYRRDQMYDSALVYLKRAQLLNPIDRELNQELLEVATGIQNWEVALSAIQGLIGSGEPASKYYKEQADMWGKLQYPGNAYYWARKALAKDTSDPAIWFMTASFAAQVDSVELALALTDSAVAKFGENDRFTANRATFLSMIGRFEEAERILRDLVKKDSTEAYFRLNLANVLAAQDDLAKKREARALYIAVKDKVGSELKLDSLIAKLDSALK